MRTTPCHSSPQDCQLYSDLSPVHTGNTLTISKARYTLATKLNSTRSTLLKVNEVDRVALAPYTLATTSTVSAIVDFVADLLSVSATVDSVASVYQSLDLQWTLGFCYS